MIFWDNYRRPDNSIDLEAVWRDQSINNYLVDRDAVEFLRQVESAQPINSRQAAAIALAQATTIARLAMRGVL